MTGELVAGDSLTATIWDYFSALQHHGLVAEMLAGVIDRPAFSYGFVHAVAQPNKIFGVITTSVKFAGILTDVGHLRHVRWAKTNDLQIWIKYNRMRGQYASVLEPISAVRFFNGAGFCNLAGTANPDPSKPACPEGISAVKAIATAQSQGQKIYTITQNNQQVVANLNLRADTLEDIQNAVQAGKEVTVHEGPIQADGWTGVGYTVTDPGTGAGGYLIEGKANGGMMLLTIATILLILVTGGVGALFYIGTAASLIASIILALAESDSPKHVFELAAIPYLTMFVVTLALVIYGGFLLPGAFFAFLAFTVGGLIAALVNWLLARGTLKQAQRFA